MDLGETSTVDYKVSKFIQKFIQTTCYASLEIENLVKSRVRIYMKIKTKILLTFPTDPKSVKQAILRIHHQLCYWLRLVTKEIDYSIWINLDDQQNGRVELSNQYASKVLLAVSNYLFH